MTLISQLPQYQFTSHWSFSWLMKYESCPMLLKLGKIDKLPEPPRPPDNPLERGNRVHKSLEDYTLGKTEVLTTEPKHIADFRPHIDHLRELIAAGMATAEQDWLLDKDWDWTKKSYGPGGDPKANPIWLWSKLDGSVYDPSQHMAVAIDYKTGGSTYKAFEHVQQLQLYAALTALRFPEAEIIHAELWYLDETNGGKPHIKSTEYSREQAMRFIGKFQARADKMYAERFFKPNPNKQTCRYCPYGPQKGTGACPVGV